jgi:hypothetical protein
MKEICERCKKYNVKEQEMLNKKLTLQETREKILIANIPLSKYVIYAGYNYYECPICRWFKFVVKK